MHEFLNSIADAYARDPEVRKYTFVFPNVRSRAYFRQYLARQMQVDPNEIGSMFLTLAELVERGCGRKIAPGERLLFMLYQAYRNVRERLGGTVEPFDRFRFWGQMILRDFNEVDRYLADPEQLFRNISDYKKIQSFYLTPEQEEIIRTFWRTDPYWKSALENRDRAEELPFWNHVAPQGAPQRKFTQLWAILSPLYNEFRTLLDQTGECYPGMAYRIVAETVMSDRRLPFNPKLYVFIGFNRLSHSEHALFSRLQRQGLAHFYWDYDPTLMNHRKANTAGRFISTYAQELRACNPEVVIPARPAVHSVEVIAVPGATAQAQVAASFLNDNETALVLADAEMLVPTVSAIPAKYRQINVTMGYPLRFSALVQLISQLTKMQMRVSFDADGNAIYFHDDVAELVKHPAIQLAWPEAAAALIPYMRQHRLFNLTAADLPEQFDCLQPLLKTVGKKATVAEIADYFNGVIDYVEQNGLVRSIDSVAVETIRESVAALSAYAAEFGIEAERRTLFDMVEHSLLDRTVPLEGESFEAMQVMGMLETRALGYTNIVMLSMTDDNYPGSESGRSFIPENLRRAYGLPTRDHSEADTAYYFYRILSWARTLTIIYDARCGAMRTGQPCRYITQLIYGDFPGVKVSERVAGFPVLPLFKGRINDGGLSKDLVKDRLAKYLDQSQLERYSLSASSIKTYMNCPKQFFFEKILKLSPPDAIERETSAADHGNVVHLVAERIYNFFRDRNGGLIERADLDNLIAGGFDGLLERELTRAVNTELIHVPPTLPDGTENPAVHTPITTGEELFYIEGLRRELHSLFRRETTPLRIIATEKHFLMPLKVSENLTLNFNMFIDRIDQIEENGRTITRIIDYKTGDDSTTFGNVEALFQVGNPKLPRAILQLMVYCMAYHQANGTDRELLRPMIFKIKDMDSPDYPMLKMGTATKHVELQSYAQVAESFEQLFAATIEEMFDTEVPITMADKEEACRFCKQFGKTCRY
ncbi:MAG: PD-(D/E)XK nuclease family protein [Muribaculaceae bacterium]|nr:PD-(D/E)XK nuclease family protein [Muribaculaceae bacterium]